MPLRSSARPNAGQRRRRLERSKAQFRANIDANSVRCKRRCRSVTGRSAPMTAHGSAEACAIGTHPATLKAHVFGPSPFRANVALYPVDGLLKRFGIIPTWWADRRNPNTPHLTALAVRYGSGKHRAPIIQARISMLFYGNSELREKAAPIGPWVHVRSEGNEAPS